MLAGAAHQDAGQRPLRFRRLNLRLRQGLRGRLRCSSMAALLDPEEHVDRLKLGAQILDFALMIALELVENRFELSLSGLDVLANDGGPLLQVAANIAH